MGEWAICRRCHKNKVNRPRGLCWTCYYTPGVLALFPSTSKYAYRGSGNITGGHAPPAAPTAAPPGSPEKMAVLAARAALGVSLWHPLDATLQTCTRTWSDDPHDDPAPQGPED